MTEAVTVIATVALSQIRLNTYNPNSMDAETFNALLKDMKEVGLEGVDPILLRPLEGTGADAEAVTEEPAYEVVDGEHRTRAALQLDWSEIRARVREMGFEEAMVVNYRKNRERGRLDPVKEGRLYKWWRDEKGLTQDQIGAKFDVTQAHVSVRIGNVEKVGAEAVQVLRGRVPSTRGEYNARYTQPDVKEKGRATKKPAPRGRSAGREEPVEARKLDMLGSINLERLLRRSRFLQGLDGDIPEEARLMGELREKYGDKVRSLQVEVAGEIREMSFREAEAYVAERWGTLVVEASNERRDRERWALKEKLEESGTIAVLLEDRNGTHRDQLTDEKGKVLSKCLRCPTPAVLVTSLGKTEPICAFGACWAETKEELEAETRRKAEEAIRRLTEAREKIISAGEAGNQEWLRLLLFLVSLSRDTRPSYLERSNVSNRWTVILGMTMGQVVGRLLALVAECLVRPRREDDEVDFLQMLGWLSETYGIDRDFLLWKPEELQDVIGRHIAVHPHDEAITSPPQAPEPQESTRGWEQILVEVAEAVFGSPDRVDEMVSW
ncbi:ParB-like nuclease domain-containing protein, partial [Candidatus Bathyarchaeota archaeon]|nr:ParB-like nuclease domain-containing protein [Candidatus Bathyarchaeota archaeon]